MKRAFFIFRFILLYSAIQAFNWLFLLLDEIFYPSYRRIRIKGPVFIIGMPRTGSTFLHNVLSGDEKQFTTLKLWESMLCPSIIQKRIALFFLSSKGFRHSKLVSLFKNTDRFIFRDFYPLHPTGLFCVEEDDPLLLPIFASQTLVYLLPEVKYLFNLVYFDEKFGERRKRVIMKYYMRIIQKHLYVFGRGKIYLTKSPYHTSKMASLIKNFPGIRFICLTREPLQVIPSAMALLKRLSRIYSGSQDIRAIREWFLPVADYWYAHPLKIFREFPNTKFRIIDFNYLITDPELVIRDIYAHFGFPLDEKASKMLRKEISNASDYRSGQVYSLDEYGLDPDTISARYHDVYHELKTLSANGNR